MTKELLQVFEAPTNINLNAVYMDVENFDIVKAPHSDKLRPTSFSLMTRK
jgi:hypothetical protein